MINKWGIAREEAEILEELEDLINRRIPVIDEIQWPFVGIKVEDKKVIGLRLCKCKLITLPDSFGQLKYLQTFHLNVNQLTTLPDSFGQLKHLQSLDLWHNKLRSLPDS
ncbi:MAG: hypothetical protein GF329_13825, partial [Candidatus Lokiarchaeota archaeon]|nr:hypothetical protein [Candidatus Lokiarchaeota archaeon]